VQLPVKGEMSSVNIDLNIHALGTIEETSGSYSHVEVSDNVLKLKVPQKVKAYNIKGKYLV
jgi:hypothetical protein